ncbi:pantoate--beta-alanine ligase [Thiohalobacter sp. IOR34]|uniref:pantoate--beta-alanine ligase n=1 Tax=Thiohalobacter sp. IOR34 TaxID=3057176 RepID=UPI0025B08F55|nr:pantoate--beta-alanine ligase [Thiohalobacter sp. IOR34]WJW74900.1 pantoate--beta-alanine ligase [Thiohalobacter sp. IOR34]
MQTVSDIKALRNTLAGWRRAGSRIGFVPTMGNLHEGHLRLVRRARELADRVVVSVFVNPLQFGPNEDYDSYPRTLEADAHALRAERADLLFAPTAATLYPRPLAAITRVQPPPLGDELCGASRPGFFVGVATVVAKLFNLVQPELAVFGEKDYQQLVLIRRMVEDLCFPIEIHGVPTVREADGLAMSSRNAYLSPEQRARAPGLYRTLRWLADELRGGRRDFAVLEAAGRERLAAAGFRPDYLSIRRAEDLAPAAESDADWVLLAAAWLGTTRLIDNIRVISD